MTTTARTSKRIHSITVKRMIDSSPDTSWLGEYSNLSDSEYSIDRKHSLDCPQNTPNIEAYRTLESAVRYLSAQLQSDGVSEGIAILVQSMDEVDECTCDERGDIARNEFRYFNGPLENYKGESPEDIRKYVRQDYERMESLNRGDWCFIGIRAEAEIQLTGGTVQRISSGGLWGVESDSEASYFSETEQDELSQLRAELEAIGFSKRTISAAFRNVEHKDN